VACRMGTFIEVLEKMLKFVKKDSSARRIQVTKKVGC
jgi:hypothetical protein